MFITHFQMFRRALRFQISPCEALISELKFAMKCSNVNKPVRRKPEEDEEDEDEMPAGVTAGSFATLGFQKLTAAE
jgi:hypothetical protein